MRIVAGSGSTVNPGGSDEPVQERLRVLQIGGIQALGVVPAVNRREQVTRLRPPAMFAPQPGEARRGAQFIGLCLLPSRDAPPLACGGAG
jgi:hypothetical protein